MFRLFIAMGAIAAVALFWMVIGGTIWWHAPQIREVVTALSRFQQCYEERTETLQKHLQDRDFVRDMYADPEFYGHYMRAKIDEVEEACLAESGFKRVVLRVIDEVDMSDADRAEIKIALAEARNLDDLKHIKRMIERAQRQS